MSREESEAPIDDRSFFGSWWDQWVDQIETELNSESNTDQLKGDLRLLFTQAIYYSIIGLLFGAVGPLLSLLTPLPVLKVIPNSVSGNLLATWLGTAGAITFSLLLTRRAKWAPEQN